MCSEVETGAPAGSLFIVPFLIREAREAMSGESCGCQCQNDMQ